jgi:hypothetical protein
MNKKRRLNELYKGVFKNDKKSCVVDLKPLDRLRELEPAKKSEEQEEKKNPEIKNKVIKPVSVSLKVGKNLGFGSFFQNVREEIIQIFTAKEDYISFEGLVNSSQINQMFNGNFNNRDSTTKKLNNIERMTENQTNHVKDNFVGIFENEEILYEDENETIYKRKKPLSRGYENYYRKPAQAEENFFFDISKLRDSNINQDSDLSDLKNNFYNNQFVPKVKNLCLQETNTLYKDVKSRRNKQRQEFSTNSENLNFLNLTDGRNLNSKF